MTVGAAWATALHLIMVHLIRLSSASGARQLGARAVCGGACRIHALQRRIYNDMSMVCTNAGVSLYGVSVFMRVSTHECFEFLFFLLFPCMQRALGGGRGSMRGCDADHARLSPASPERTTATLAAADPGCALSPARPARDLRTGADPAPSDHSDPCNPHDPVLSERVRVAAAGSEIKIELSTAGWAVVLVGAPGSGKSTFAAV
jgi:hypothetical protein